MRPSHCTRPFFVNSLADIVGEALILRTLNSDPRPLFRVPRGPPPARCSVALNLGLAAGVGTGRFLPPPPRIVVQGRFFGGPRGPRQRAAPWPSISVWQHVQVRAGISVPRIEVQGCFFGAPGAPASASCSVVFNFGLAAGAGRYLSPQITVPGRFFGAPGPPPACCSVALNFGLAARAGAGRYLSPPNSGPRPLFWGPRQRAALWPSSLVWAMAHCDILYHQNSGPRPLYWGAPGAPASALLRGPQFRSALTGTKFVCFWH